MIDLTAIENQILQAIAGVILLGVLYMMKNVSAWLHIKLSETKKAQIEDAASKALAYGITQADGLIRTKGWDHVEVKNAVVAAAAEYATQKFPEAVANAGIDTTSVQTVAETLGPLLERKFPQAATEAAASPVTPPAPSVPTMPSFVLAPTMPALRQ